MIQEFLIADFRIRITHPGLLERLGHFGRALRLFEVEADPEKEVILTLGEEESSEPDFGAYTLLDSFDFSEVEARCEFRVRGEEYLFTMDRPSGVIWFLKSLSRPEVKSNLKRYPDCAEFASLMRFGLWMMFGVAITPRKAIAIHSSTIRCGEKAALFLGESGTGKSTHTRLWREHIAGAVLLNDDSPIIRIKEGKALVYGSPWSGKTPCYKQEQWPISGFVRLSQAPHNRITPLKGIRAIGALLPSCPPAFAYDNLLQDAICCTLSEMLSLAPVFHLECLPDQAAAELSYATLWKE